MCKINLVKELLVKYTKLKGKPMEGVCIKKSIILFYFKGQNRKHETKVKGQCP